VDLLVPFPQFAVWRSEREGRDSLTALRLVFLSSIVTLLLVAVITWAIQIDGTGDGSISPPVFAGLTVLQGVLGLAMIGVALRRDPDVTSREGAAGWFNTVALLGMSLAQASFLLGFVGTFVTNERTMIFAGVPFALAGLWMSAPTARRLAAAQQQLARSGASVDLVDALRTTPFKRSGAAAARRASTGSGRSVAPEGPPAPTPDAEVQQDRKGP
jgi:hypothetical protein